MTFCGDMLLEMMAVSSLDFLKFTFIYVTAIAMLYCFTVQNFNEIRQSASELLP